MYIHYIFCVYSVIDLKKPGVSDPATTPTGSSFAADLLKRRKIEKATETQTEYIDCKFILPTSNLLERFFSSATFTYSDLRQRLLPMNLESQLFLKMNYRLWDEALVADCLKLAD